MTSTRWCWDQFEMLRLAERRSAGWQAGDRHHAAIWWMALRDNGIEDKIYGCGRLLREF